MQIVSHSKEVCVEANALALALILTPDFFLEYLLNCGNLEQWGQDDFLGMVTSPRERHDVWNLPYGHSSLLHTMVFPSHNVLQKHMLPSLGPFTSSMPRLVYQHPSTWGRTQICQNASSFRRIFVQCCSSGRILSITNCAFPFWSTAYTTKS